MAMQQSPDVGQPQPNVGSLDIERALVNMFNLCDIVPECDRQSQSTARTEFQLQKSTLLTIPHSKKIINKVNQMLVISPPNQMLMIFQPNKKRPQKHERLFT